MLGAPKRVNKPEIPPLREPQSTNGVIPEEGFNFSGTLKRSGPKKNVLPHNGGASKQFQWENKELVTQRFKDPLEFCKRGHIEGQYRKTGDHIVIHPIIVPS